MKARRRKTISHANRPQKKARVAIFISDKLDFKPKTVVRDVERHYVILKVSIQQENLTIVNIYAPNMGAANCTSQLLTEMKRHIDNSTLIVGDLNTPLPARQII